MVNKKRFYVTTAIDYVNAEPHIGHAYQKVIADVLARYHQIKREDVWFLTGTDEHGKKIAISAKNAGLKEQDFVDLMSKKFKESWKKLNINPSRFIRTTDRDHKELVKRFIERVYSKGDIYKGVYEGYYCTNCESYYTEKDLIDNCCPIHKSRIEILKEETYFFKLSKYSKELLKLYESKNFILPKERKNEIVNRVRDGLQDLSITRTNFSWGIPFPLDKKHVTYVWFDALINYISGSNNKKYWPADIHLLGKDNGWFHAVIWPAMLMSAGYKLPKTVFIHGFLTVNGQKISKSLGNSISPDYLVDKYGADSIRYFLVRSIPFGEDGDFSESLLVERYNSELTNKLGNLVSRVSALAEKHGIKRTRNMLLKKLDLKKIDELFSIYRPDLAINELFQFIDECNLYIQNKRPWEEQCKNKQEILYELVDSIKAIGILIYPFMPETGKRISQIFNFNIDYLEIERPIKEREIKKAEHLFKRIEVSSNKEDRKIESNSNQKKEEKSIKTISFEEWEKIDLRIARIIGIEEIQNSDKLYKITLSLGDEKRVICAGLKKHYRKEDLINKKVVFLSNLESRKIMGVESSGMILAAVSDDEKTISILLPEKDIKEGSKLR
ncbi:MAG: methionine--tRNA ligase [Candidatus Pacearchaeota archaeon]